MLDDQPHWRWSKNGVFFFSVKSTYNYFIDGSVVSEDTSWIWKTASPPKIRVFL